LESLLATDKKCSLVYGCKPVSIDPLVPLPPEGLPIHRSCYEPSPMLYNVSRVLFLEWLKTVTSPEVTFISSRRCRRQRSVLAGFKALAPLAAATA
jgi:hypothetical protein